MIDLIEFYEKAYNGEAVDKELFCQYLKSFDNVILWGAGNLGKSIGEKILKLGINITCYWDKRADEIGTLNNINVSQPFEYNFVAGKHIVIVTVSNVFITESIINQLTKRNIPFIIGDALYQAIICELSLHNFNPQICRDATMCNLCTCKRFFNVAKQKYSTSKNSFINSTTFIINQKCSLKCKYCSLYSNSYPLESRVNFSLAQILNDVDRFFGAIDYVPNVQIFGGEPFLHDGLDEIVKRIAEKKNVGVISIDTNGICKMSSELLNSLKFDNVRIVFSNYTECISEEQKDIYYKNIELAKASGIAILLQNKLPEWGIPTTLEEKDYSIDTMINKRRCCYNSQTVDTYVKNGIFYPCAITNTIHSLNIADYNFDYVIMNRFPSAIKLAEQIMECMNKKYFLSCKHCGETGITKKAGEQGFFDFLKGE